MTDPDGPLDTPPACTTALALGADITSAVGSTGVSLVIGRYDAGAVNDVAIAVGGDTTLMLGSAASPGTFTLQQSLTQPAIGLITDDFDTAGTRDDIVVLTATGASCREHAENGGAGQFTAAAAALPGAAFTNADLIFKGEFGGAPGVPEPVIHDDTGNIVFTANNPACSFTRAQTVGGGGDRVVFVGQIDKSGEQDILMVDGNGNVKLALSDGGDGTFNAPTMVATNATGRGVGVGNFDDDTFLDIIVATAAGGEVYLQNSASPGVFTKQTGTFSGITSTVPLLVGDVNGDALDDVITPTAVVMQCPTTHVFTQVESISAANALLGLVDGDTKLDLLRLSGTDLIVRLQQ